MEFTTSNLSYSPTLADEIYSLAYRATRDASKERETAALSGEHSEAYEELTRELEKARDYLAKELERVAFLRTHRHQWGENDYCVHCGADGRA